MMKYLVIFAATVAVCMGQGPTQPDRRGVCDKVGKITNDQQNMCWYHECIQKGSNNELSYMPRMCALGSKVSYNYVDGEHNPCTINFDDVTGYDCERDAPSVDGPPPCHAEAVRKQCLNGGEAVYEADKCWCKCPPTWQGDSDCSKPKRDVTDLPSGSDICVDGNPQDDFCSKSGGGCLNGGTCYNQCDTFWCECPNRKEIDYYGKRCELKPRIVSK